MRGSPKRLRSCGVGKVRPTIAERSEEITYDYGHLSPEADTMAAAKLDPIRIPRARAEVGIAGAAGVGVC